MLFGSKEEIERGYREMIKEESFNSGMEQGNLDRMQKTYKNCIAEGMTKEMALKISELPADMIPED